MPKTNRKLDNKQIFSLQRSKPASYWDNLAKKQSLELFNLAAEDVPAYKDFLKKSVINPVKIKNWDDFIQIPTISKTSYLKKYPFEKLIWQGALKNKSLVFTSTSGSTGEPFYFPRGNDLDWQYSIILEQFLKNGSYPKESTLVLVCFGMGVWIGGLITYKGFEIASQRGEFPVSILTPGINKAEIFKALKKLSPLFKTTILVGYPPFVKDIIDESSQEGIDLKKLNLRLVFAAESFNEKFRDYLGSKAGIKNVHLDTMNIYGSADIGAMASETPIAILIRRLAVNNPKLFEDIFGNIKKVPTLAQFNPLFINFESIQGSILLTGNNALPLIRYAIGDNGGAISYSDVAAKIKNAGIDLDVEARKVGIKPEMISKMPLVFVYERDDFSTTLYGLQIYPENIREVLIESPFNKYLSGKMTLITRFNHKHDQYLEINLELQKNAKINKKMENMLLKRIILNLRLKNSEFRELSNYLKDRAEPKLIFWPAEDPEYFRPGIKQKWSKK